LPSQHAPTGDEETPFTDTSITLTRGTRACKLRCICFVLVLSLLTNAVLSVFFVWAIGLIPNLGIIFGYSSTNNGTTQDLQDSCSNPLDDSHICIPRKIIGKGYMTYKLQHHVRTQTVNYKDDKFYELSCFRQSKHFVEFLKVVIIMKYLLFVTKKRLQYKLIRKINIYFTLQ